MSRIKVDEKLYHDAVSLSPQEWMDKYKIHKGYAKLIEHYRVGEDGSPPFALSAEIEPKLAQGWARLFLLGTQIASEDQGLQGRPPAHKFGIGIPNIRKLGQDGKLEIHEDLCATIPHKGIINIVATRKNIERTLGTIGVNAGHLPTTALDPFQAALSLGLEEGLHAAMFNKSQFEQLGMKLQAFDNFPTMEELLQGGEKRFEYAFDEHEGAIHSHLVRLHEELGLKYDKKRWQSFIDEHKFSWKDIEETAEREASKMHGLKWAAGAVAGVAALEGGYALYVKHRDKEKDSAQTPSQGSSI